MVLDDAFVRAAETAEPSARARTPAERRPHTGRKPTERRRQTRATGAAAPALRRATDEPPAGRPGLHGPAAPVLRLPRLRGPRARVLGVIRTPGPK
ncbi:SCO2583/SCO2584 N-terminal domain-containing protein [Streptomyces prasinus]